MQSPTNPNVPRGHLPPRSNPSIASIESLQAYITELTLYINENNHKYNKNMLTLKQFYQAQVGEMQAERNQAQEEVVLMRNQVANAREVLASRNLRVRQLEEELAMAREQEEVTRDKLMSERRKIDQLYQEMADIRQISQQAIEQANNRASSSEDHSRELSLAIQQRKLEIQSLHERIRRLQDQLSQRYSLPEKIKDIQLQNGKLKTALQAIKRRLAETEQNMDFKQAEMEGYRKENQSLRILKGKFNAEKALQIEKAVKLQRDNAEHRTKRVQAQRQSLVYQLNESESSIKSLKSQMEKLQSQLLKQVNNAKQSQHNMQAVIQSKDAYISQFAQLKEEYQAVIKRLQDSLIDYQKKNWNLEQQNKELNEQLDQLKELLQEVKAINALQPARKEYRKLAEMEVIASRPLPQKQPPSSSLPTLKESGPAGEGDYSGDWQKLMRQIDNIKA